MSMKREEQIEKARELLACGVLSKEACDAIKNDFPELSESEDERIRKFLLDYAIEMIAGLESDISLSTYDGIKGHDPDAEAELTQWQKARGYLEKQKEQEPLDIPSAGSGAQGTTPPLFKLDVKPAEWSEEDEDKIDSIIGIICSERECAKIANIGEEKEDNSAFYNELVLFLKSLRPQPHWKPSELQMDALKNSAYGTYQNGDGPALRELYEQLKKLY